MKGRVALVVASLSLLLAACEADQPLPAADPGFEPGSVHLMPIDGESPAVQEDLQDGANATKLRYYGGHVIPNAKVVVVLWGSGVSSTVKSGLPGFYASVLDSPYLDWLSEYDTDLSGGTNQHIGRGSYAGTVTITPSHGGSTVDDTQIQSELSAQITAGKLPAPDANTIYMTYFPHGTTITQGGSSSCSTFCAYHGTFKRGGKSTYYGVIPDMGAGSGCDSGCGNGTLLENVTSVSSHELVEAITDGEIGLATSVGKPMAWYDPANGEIGDICNGEDGTTAGYRVQKEWDNATSSCIVSKGGATNDFSLALSPASKTIARGSAASVSVKTAVVAGAAESVTLSVTGLPAGVTASFSPSPVTSGNASTLMLAVGNSAAPGTYAFAVKGTAASGTHSRSGSLIVSGGTGGGNLVTNGSFEGSLSGWTLGGAKHPIDSSAETHGGSYAMRLGATTTTEPSGDSSAIQTVTIPSGAASATLTFWFYAKSADTVSHDWQEAEVRDASGATLKTVFHQASNARTWTQQTVDLSAWKGQTIQLWFDVHESGGTTPTSLWIDDVSLTTS